MTGANMTKIEALKEGIKRIDRLAEERRIDRETITEIVSENPKE